MFDIAVFYNNFNLTSIPGVKIVNYNVTDMPSRILNNSKLARSNRSVLTSAEYTSKRIFITGFVGGNNWQAQMDNFDALKAKVQDVEGVIRVQQGTKSVEYVGTLNGMSKTFNGPSLGFTFEFLCSDPIGKASTGSTLIPPTVITTSSANLSLNIGGSFRAEPRFSMTINSVTDGTDKSISLINAATGKGIKVTRDWIAGDIIEINSDTMEVVVNTELIDFSGQFPTFLPGTRTLQYIDDFTTRNVTISAVYIKRYA